MFLSELYSSHPKIFKYLLILLVVVFKKVNSLLLMDCGLLKIIGWLKPEKGDTGEF